MKRASIFIDGFNFYHSIIENRKLGFRKYLWLNYNALAKRKLGSRFALADIYYFSALAYWRPDSVKRHKIFLRACAEVGINPVLGKFKKKHQYCKMCKQYFESREEKQSDVNIAVYMLREAALNSYDVGIVGTNDTDLVPVIKTIKQIYPDKQVGVLFPFGRKANELIQSCDFYIKLKEKDLASCQFPDTINLPSGRKLYRPAEFN